LGRNEPNFFRSRPQGVQSFSSRQAVKDFGDAKQSHNNRHDIEALEQKIGAKGQPVRAGVHIHSNRGNHKSDEGRSQAFGDRSAPETRGAGEAEKHQGQVFEGSEFQSQVG